MLDYLHLLILTSQLIYRAEVTNRLDDEYMYYLGLAETTIKERYRNHKSSFNNDYYENSPELSEYVLLLKEMARYHQLNES